MIQNKFGITLAWHISLVFYVSNILHIPYTV